MEFISLTSLVVALIEIYSFIENKYKAIALIKKPYFHFFRHIEIFVSEIQQQTCILAEV